MPKVMPPFANETKAMSSEAVRRIVDTAVRETLMQIGFDASQPAELQADMHYLRRLRKGSEEARAVVRRSVLTVLATTVIYLLWEALKQTIKDFKGIDI